MGNDHKESNHEMQKTKQKKSTKSMNPLQSVGLKLFVYIIGGILACVLTMGILAYNESKKIIETKVSQSSQQTITQLAVNLDNVMKKYDDITLQILVDSAFHELVDTLQSSTLGEYEKFEATKELSNKLQSIIFGNDNIAGMALIPVNNDQLSIITAGNSQLSKVESLLEEPWIEQVQELGGRTLWLDSRANSLTSNNTMPSFGVARLLKNTSSSVAHYILLLDIPTKGILDELNKVSLGEGSQISVVNEDHNFMVHGDSASIATPAAFALDGSEHNSVSQSIEGIGDVLLIHHKLAFASWYLVGSIPVEELVKDAIVIRTLTVQVAIAAALIAILIAIIVMLTIGKPLIQLRDLMQEGAKGNLTVRSKIRKRKDEIGQLSDSFDQMMTQITNLAVQTKTSADAVLTTASVLTDASKKTAISAKEIAVATEEIANGSTSLAVEAERGNDITLAINDQMKQVLASNEQMVQSAYEVEQASGKGTAYMAELIDKTGQTEEMTREMVTKVDALKDSTRSIVQILDVLNAVTKQTNILSLNATIEASRAGSAGRGFMVVANEIRELADQSTQSIDVVGQITGRIQNEIVETVEVLSRAYPMFQEQIHSVKEANHIFVNVQQQMGRLIAKLEEVMSSVKALEASQNVLNEAMSNVSAVAQQSSATSEEVASLSAEQLNVSDNLVLLSTELSQVSTALKETLSQFKV
ncbi:methyl-accepting chemotaxis protein [Paenibacillus montaniterrae]|uniref:Methyl-accepting chemotaxis protein n=2 Tax=Paenibacillus montaniterrae TaxID=429341 RepID=A0A920CXF0_9BACL|nr:methyl-accepting chemotaxis protein [Paenibacillus montaniterrae]